MIALLRLASFTLALFVLAFVVGVAAASAADLSPAEAVDHAAAAWRIIDEARLGIFAHDVASPEGGTVDVNGELLSSRFPLIAPASAWYFLAPRVSIGTTLNTGGKTSAAYAGLAWTADIFDHAFVEASFGGAIHDGDTGRNVAHGRSGLGCSPLFRESLSAGYRIDAHWSVMATVEHMSNANLCVQNRGLTNYGVRIGYSF